jgi:release factor glutamine methyltransferase
LSETVVGAGWSVGEAVARGAAALQTAGCDTPRLDAELLAAEALDLTRERLLMERDSMVDRAALVRLAALLARREAREPVAYILGRKGFRHISLAVDRRVLIPRPETELLVEVGLTLEEGATVVDVGTGSGAVALALKDERSDLSVAGTDLSADALAVARANAARLGLDVRLVQADLLDSVEYDAVLANLPYVPDGSVLEPEISAYEPPQALFAGVDGLDVIRRLVSIVSLAPVGPRRHRSPQRSAVGASGLKAGDRRPSLLALEVGSDQAAAVASLLRRSAFSSVAILRDLAGHQRVVVGRR